MMIAVVYMELRTPYLLLFAIMARVIQTRPYVDWLSFSRSIIRRCRRWPIVTLLWFWLCGFGNHVGFTNGLDLP